LHRIVWTRQAREDLQRIRDYISQFAPLAAQRFAVRLVTSVESLTDQPRRGRPVPNGERELAVVPPYLIRYRIMAGDVEVLTIRHGARLSGR